MMEKQKTRPLKTDKFMILLDRTGQPDTVPDDFHTDYGKPLFAWLAEEGMGAKDQNPFFNKLALAHRAISFYTTMEYAEPSDLRHEPFVLENYNPGNEGTLERFFIFKQDNNGTTFKIKELNPEIF